MEVRDTAHLVNAERVEVVAEVRSGDVLRAVVDALARHAIDAISRRPAEVINDYALEVVVRLRADGVRISDAGRRDQLEAQHAVDATDRKAAVTVDRTLLRGQLHQLAERVPARDVSLLAPRVEVLRDNAVVGLVAGRRRVLVRRQVVSELAGNLARLGEVLNQIARLPHHHDAGAGRLRGLARLAVGFRRVDAIGDARVVGVEFPLHAGLEPLETPRRSNGLNGTLEPRLLVDDLRGVEVVHVRDQLPLKLTNVCPTAVPLASSSAH